MPQRHRAPYSPEFRRQMVELVRSGRDPEQLAREFEPSAQAIRNWVAQADRDEGRREDGLTTIEREELRRLRRENRQLRDERPAAVLDERCGYRQQACAGRSRRSAPWSPANAVRRSGAARPGDEGAVSREGRVQGRHPDPRHRGPPSRSRWPASWLARAESPAANPSRAAQAATLERVATRRSETVATVRLISPSQAPPRVASQNLASRASSRTTEKRRSDGPALCAAVHRRSRTRGESQSPSRRAWSRGSRGEAHATRISKSSSRRRRARGGWRGPAGPAARRKARKPARIAPAAPRLPTRGHAGKAAAESSSCVGLRTGPPRGRFPRHSPCSCRSAVS